MVRFLSSVFVSACGQIPYCYSELVNRLADKCNSANAVSIEESHEAAAAWIEANLVPEPSSALLGLGAFLALLAVNRRTSSGRITKV